jgi:hypothetical protein
LPPTLRPHHPTSLPSQRELRKRSRKWCKLMIAATSRRRAFPVDCAEGVKGRWRDGHLATSAGLLRRVPERTPAKATQRSASKPRAGMQPPKKSRPLMGVSGLCWRRSSGEEGTCLHGRRILRARRRSRGLLRRSRVVAAGGVRHQANIHAPVLGAPFRRLVRLHGLILAQAD